MAIFHRIRVFRGCAAIGAALLMLVGGCAVVPAPIDSPVGFDDASVDGYDLVEPSPFFYFGFHGVHRHHKPNWHARPRSHRHPHRNQPGYRDHRPDGGHTNRVRPNRPPGEVHRPRRDRDAGRRGHRRGDRQRDNAPSTGAPPRNRARPSIDRERQGHAERPQRSMDNINNQP